MNLVYLFMCIVVLCVLNLHTRIVRLETRNYYNKKNVNYNNRGVHNDSK